MLRKVLWLRSKRTPGYVFWRQSTLVELEHAKRNYLLSERPLPIADIARRMVNVKSRYLATKDFHEQNLLRGEYKYFSGKVCDTRHARPEDMVAYAHCGSFFGFWDAGQMDCVLRELFLKLDELGPNELVTLFTSLPALRKQTGELYTHVSRRLVDEVPGLSLEECVRVATACDESSPHALLKNLIRAILPEVACGNVNSAQCTELMDTLGSCCPPEIQRDCELFFHELKRSMVSGFSQLSVLDIAVACASLRLRDELDAAAADKAVRLFVDRREEACARSTALMFTSVGNNIEFVRAMGDRVVFLTTDFTPTEMLSVFAAYLRNVLSLRAGLQGDAKGTSFFALNSLDPKGMRGSSNTHFPIELQLAQRHLTALTCVLRMLMDQMVSTLESATAFVSPAAQVQYLAVFHEAIKSLHGDASHLIKLLPSIGRCMRLLCAKVIASLFQYTYSELVGVLQLSGSLGNSVTNSIVGAVVQELIRRDVCVSSAEAEGICATLQQISGLTADHRSRIERTLIPKLRGQGAQRGL
ncbi:hypothetical protein ERJ75_000103600 [Trypanosoma vivax]|uniref:Mitochondrial RNA binding complex 1 subunit n=1 Tax=Trypanosoma vivax (strain Y486) TaxID=1055687 RepID=G0U179_TRYVY|nr:hypothetical protein TRVL_06073 [Trypanosoma vivax]KAH8609263.1 hypothetical protein ERJ75_001222900 [Trypanosoma vivax]KAH8620044.1 hypothetical protein ERJ75_000103600 [Trypanosoma vivax]CCC49834.1 conserved hypothetical protein [Trypanosoma vivax Y486]